MRAVMYGGLAAYFHKTFFLLCWGAWGLASEQAFQHVDGPAMKYDRKDKSKLSEAAQRLSQQYISHLNQRCYNFQVFVIYVLWHGKILNYAFIGGKAKIGKKSASQSNTEEGT